MLLTISSFSHAVVIKSQCECVLVCEGCVYVRASQQAASLSVVSVTGIMVKIMVVFSCNKVAKRRSSASDALETKASALCKYIIGDSYFHACLQLISLFILASLNSVLHRRFGKLQHR